MINIKKDKVLSYLFIVTLVVIMCDNISVASVQQQPQEKEKVKSDTVPGTKLKPIKLSDLSKESYRHKELIKEIESNLLTDKELLREETTIDSVVQKVDEFIEANAIDSAEAHLFILESNRRKWYRLKLRLEEEQLNVSKSLDDLYAQTDKLNNIATSWDLTKKAQKDTAILSVINKRTDDLLLNVNEVNRKIISLIEFFLLQSDKIARRQVYVENFIKSIDKSINQSKSTLFKKNAPFLFREFFKAGEFKFSSLIKSVAEGIKQDFKYFGYMYEKEVIVNIIIFILLVLLFYPASIKLRDDEYCKEMGFSGTTINVLRRPLSVALLLFFFISYSVFSYANPIIQSIITILALVPIAILSSRVITGRMKKFIYLLLLAYIPIVFTIMLPQNVLLSRLLLLSISLYSIVVFLPLVRHSSWSDVISSLAIRKWVLIIINSFLAFQVISMILNIAGFVKIAGALSVSTIKIIVSVFIYYLLIIIVKAIFIMIIKSRYISSLPVFKKNLKVITAKTQNTINFAGFIGWIYNGLLTLNIKDYVFNKIQQFNNAEIRLGELKFTPGNFITFFLILYISVVVTNVVKGILEDGILPRLKLKRGVPATISILVKYALITAGFMIAVSAVGINLDKLTILIGAFGVGIGFGLQNIFNNLISGLILLFERPIYKNDVVEVGTLIGQVRDIGFRSSNIRTFDGAEVIVPNGHLISNEVINWTLSDQQKRIEVIAGVAYGSDVDKVMEIMRNVLNNHEDIMKEPEPLVLFKEMGESSLDFRLLFWIDDYAEWIRIRSEIVYMIHRELTSAGISIPFPQRDIHIKEDKLKDEDSKNR